MNDKQQRKKINHRKQTEVQDVMELFRLDGKKAYVTGGARGIGKSIASALAEAGAAVAIVDIDMDEAQKTASKLKQAGADVIALQADVTDPESVRSFVSKVAGRFGSVDIAVNNAGICINAPAEDMTLTQWKSVLDVNLTGVFLTSQEAGRQMIRQGSGGAIINIASMSAHIVNHPQPQCAYNASKAGVIQLSKSLAVEWIGHGIRVNTISPGYIGTELILSSPALKPLIQIWESMSPTGRIGKPEELQAIAVYLCCDAASFTTGADFVIDGAFSCI